MAKEKYVAYVGTYTHGIAEGIHIFDVDTKKGHLKLRNAIEVNNPSHMTKSYDNRFLYSICDEGIASFAIQEDGSLKYMNVATIRGMRGCFLSVTRDNRFIVCAGYHDGKVTVLRIEENGEVGTIVSEVFHHGMGSVAEKNFRPHVSCVKFTPDEKYLCAVDYGLDHVKVYSFDNMNGKLSLVDIIRCEIESAPRRMCFSNNGKYCYILCESSKNVYGFTYEPGTKCPTFEEIGQWPTVCEEHARGSAASALIKSPDGNYLMCSNDGDNSVVIWQIDETDGHLTELLNLPISGHYPKEVAFFPDGKHLMSLNHESESITTLDIDYKEKNLYWNSKPIEIKKPNCVVLVPIKK